MQERTIKHISIVLIFIAATCVAAIAISGHPMSAIGQQRWFAILTLSLSNLAVMQIAHRQRAGLKSMRVAIAITSISIIATWIVGEAIHKYIAVRTSHMEREIEAGHPIRDY